MHVLYVRIWRSRPSRAQQQQTMTQRRGQRRSVAVVDGMLPEMVRANKCMGTCSCCGRNYQLGVCWYFIHIVWQDHHTATVQTVLSCHWYIMVGSYRTWTSSNQCTCTVLLSYLPTIRFDKNSSSQRESVRAISTPLRSIMLHEFRLRMRIGRFSRPRPQLSARPIRSI